MIGAEQLAMTKPGVIIVNAARGGLVEEAALADALRSGQVGAAGIDVYATEPCTDSPLFALPNVVVTPHLGASTTEAQDKAGTAVARSVRLALQGDFVPDAVNVQAGGIVAEDVRPGPAAGREAGPGVHRRRRGSGPVGRRSRCCGKIAEFDVSVRPARRAARACSPTSSRSRSPTSTPRCWPRQRGLEVSLTQRRGEPALPQPGHGARGHGRRHRR